MLKSSVLGSGLKTRHLRIGQPEKVAHVHHLFLDSEPIHPYKINGS